ncbi:MAG: hypothetical protein ABH986_02275 [archaeon]
MNPFFLAFFLTNLIEFFPFYFLIKKPLKEKVFFLILINSLTLPLLWILLPFFFDYYLIAFFFFEFSIAVIEAFLIRFLLKQSLKNSFIVSFSMNFISAATGFMFFW